MERRAAGFGAGGAAATGAFAGVFTGVFMGVFAGVLTGYLSGAGAPALLTGALVGGGFLAAGLEACMPAAARRAVVVAVPDIAFRGGALAAFRAGARLAAILRAGIFAADFFALFDSTASFFVFFAGFAVFSFLSFFFCLAMIVLPIVADEFPDTHRGTQTRERRL
jgi:hypothetical protein